MWWLGIYLAEDIAKSDQYAEADVEYDGSGDNAALHERLYPDTEDGAEHPGDVCYVLVCRAALGW